MDVSVSYDSVGVNCIEAYILTSPSSHAGTYIINFFPFLEHLPGDPFKWKKVLSNVVMINRFLERQVEKHAKVHTEEEESTDFIHAYIREIRKHEASGNDNTTVNSSLVY